MGETTWQGQDPPNNEEIYKYLLEKISQLENRNLELREQLRQLEVEKRYTETQKIRYERDVRKLKSEIEQL
ncbi:MAG TPA: proteasome-activating nucleotidase, partial [Methanomicrobiales archaeon]|nr:proteasome-activating nucleotidase [Methanomicrobiales archaeon]